MTVSVPCARCGRPTDATLCDGCTRHLRVVLRAVPDQIRDLELAAARESAMPASAIADEGCTHAGDCGCGVAVPWSQWASRSAHRLRNALASWTRVLIAETHGHPPTCGHGTCRDTRPRCRMQTEIRRTLVTAAASPAVFLAGHLDSIRLREWAGEFARDIDRRTADAWHAVDLPVDGLYAGPCGGTIDGGTCERRLWATPEQGAIQCRTCGNIVIVADRQAIMLDAAAGLLMPAGQIATALTLMLRRRVSANTIRSWAHRGILTRRDIPPTTSPTYRVGDVLDLIRRGESTEPEKASTAS